MSHHTPPPALPVPSRAARWLLVALAPWFGGCAMSIPMGSLMPGDDVTGSNSPVPFGRMLDEEDRRREKAAIATALDPQGDGSTIKWENPKTGNKGAISAIGKAYNSDASVCRAFLSDLKPVEGAGRTLQGTACLVAAGEWAVRDAKPFKRS